MIHLRQRLPLDLEIGLGEPAHQAALHQLQRHRPLHRLTLVGQPDHAHPARAELLPQLVGAHPHADRH